MKQHVRHRYPHSAKFTVLVDDIPADLTERVLQRRLAKLPALRLSDWEAAPLSQPQASYAALDAFACLLIHQVPTLSGCFENRRPCRQQCVQSCCFIAVSDDDAVQPAVRRLSDDKYFVCHGQAQ